MDILREIRALAQDLRTAQLEMRQLSTRLARRSQASQDAKVAAELKKFLLDIPGVREEKIPDAVRAFGQAIQPAVLFGSAQAPAKILHLDLYGSLADEDASIKLALVFDVKLAEPINRAILVAGGRSLSPGAKLPSKLALETAKFLGDRAGEDLDQRFYQSFLQRNPEVVQALKAEYGTSTLRIRNPVKPKISPSGGLFAASAMVRAEVKLDLAPERR